MATFLISLALYIHSPPHRVDAFMAFSGGRYYNEVLAVTDCQYVDRHSLVDFCQSVAPRFEKYSRWFCVRTTPKWSFTECQSIVDAKVRWYSKPRVLPYHSVVLKYEDGGLTPYVVSNKKTKPALER